MLLLPKDLYRALLREAGRLVDPASMAHYRTKIQASFRRDPVPESSVAALKRTKDAQRLLRRLQAANDGYLHSLTRVLDTTYGRRGPDKHAVLRNLHPDGLGRTSFNSAISALVLSPISHTSRPPQKAHLTTPNTLPPRAFPDSEEARLLGPLTPQRIHKIRLRFKNEQMGKIRAPIALVTKRDGVDLNGGEGVYWTRRNEVLKGLEAKSTVGGDDLPRPPRRLQTREQRATPGIKIAKGTDSLSRTTEPSALRILPPFPRSTKWHRPKTVSARLLRRRYQAILYDSPILVLSDPQKANGGSYSVTRSDWAKGGSRHLEVMSAEDAWWSKVGEAVVAEGKGKRGAIRG